MLTPASTNLISRVGDDFSLVISVTDGAGDPFDFTGCTGLFRVYNKIGATLLDKTSTGDAANVALTEGAITVTLPRDDSEYAALPAGEYRWEIAMTLSTGELQTWVVGDFVHQARRGAPGTQSNTLSAEITSTTVTLTVLTPSTVIPVSQKGTPGGVTANDADNFPAQFANLTAKTQRTSMRRQDAIPIIRNGTTEYVQLRDLLGRGLVRVTDFDSIQTAIAEAETVRDLGYTPILQFPSNVAYEESATVEVPPGISVDMQAPLVYTGAADEPALVIGQEGMANGYLFFRINVERLVRSDWEDEDSIGVRLLSPTNCQVEIVRAVDFTVGAQMVGWGGGCAYNETLIGNLWNNKVGLDLASADGWCNENLFRGGRIWRASTAHAGKDCIGIRIRTMSGAYVNNNNNVFLKPSVEIGAAGTFMVIENGNYNKVIDARSETNAVGVRFENGSGQNWIEFGYASHTTSEIDNSSYGGNVVISNRFRHWERLTREVFSIKDIRQAWSPYDGTPRVQVAGCSWHNGGLSATSITIGSDYIEFGGSRGLGVRIDTTIQKEFLVHRDIAPGNAGGRIVVKCFDASGTLLTNLGPGHPYVKGIEANTISYSSALSGVYRTGADSAEAVYLKVTDDVKEIWLGVSGGSGSMQLRGFAIYTTPEGTAPRVWPGLTVGAQFTTRVASQSPQASGLGTWAVGDIIYNAEPASGEPVGWICTAAGSPGTWQGFGTIA